MKKTFTINLNGRGFTIDDDACELLENFLEKLRFHYRNDENCNRIIADYEARIEQVFSEHLRKGNEVISLGEVQSAIKQIDTPKGFNDSYNEHNHSNASTKKIFKKKFYRDTEHRLLGGVCSGVAAYFGWDVTPVRVLFVVFGLIPCFWAIWLYLIVWIVAPEAVTINQKEEMRGQKESIEDIGRVISDKVNDTFRENKGCIGSFFDILAGGLKVLFIIAAILIGIPILFALCIVLIVLFSVVFGVGSSLLSIPLAIFGYELENITIAHPTLALIAFLFALGIPFLAIMYTLLRRPAKLNRLPGELKIVGVGAWVISVILLASSGFNLQLNEVFNSNRNRIIIDNGIEVVEESGQTQGRTENLPYFEIVELEGGVVSHTCLEQNSSDAAQIHISGDANVINRIKWTVSNNKLTIRAKPGRYKDLKNKVTIRINAPVFKGVKIEATGNITIPNRLETDNFFAEIEGAGRFHADSLYCHFFRAEIEGAGNISISGKAVDAKLSVEGVGHINARDFETENITATVEGVGNINCNPTQSLTASIEGAGKVTYRNDPPVKNINIEGIGSIGRE